MTPGLEGAVISAGGMEVEEEVFQDLAGLALVLEVFDQGDAFHEMRPDPVEGSGTRLGGCGWLRSWPPSSSRAGDRPGLWRPWPPDGTVGSDEWVGQVRPTLSGNGA